jgi:hypothetical protein
MIQASLFTTEPQSIPVTDVQCEKARRATHRAKILSMLRAGTVTSLDLVQVSHRFSARIMELRQLGYRIKTEHARASGASWYTLLGEPGEAQ